jgi:hypothetical protein
MSLSKNKAVIDFVKANYLFMSDQAIAAELTKIVGKVVSWNSVRKIRMKFSLHKSKDRYNYFP